MRNVRHVVLLAQLPISTLAGLMLTPAPMRAAANKMAMWARAALGLALIALALRVLVPSGFMVPAADQGVGFPIVLCTAQGVQTVVVDQEGQLASPDPRPSGDHSPASQPHHSCAFAGVAQALGAPQSLHIGLAGWTFAEHAFAAGTPAAPGRGLAAPPPPQTGPPLQI